MIITNGVIKATRFQFVETEGNPARFFDSATGRVYTFTHKGWKSSTGLSSSSDFLDNYLKAVEEGTLDEFMEENAFRIPRTLSDIWCWVKYQEESKMAIREAHKH